MTATADARVPAPLHSREGILASERDLEVLRSFARRIDPTDPGAHNNLGVLYFNKGLYDDAVGAFMRALELDARMQVAQRNLEIAYLNSGAAERRIALLREYLRSNPSDREARWEFGRTSALLGRHAEAVDAFQELLKYYPYDLGALIQVALSEKEIGDIEVAQRWLEQALEVDQDSSLVHFYLGEIAYNRGLLDDAVARLRSSIELNPDNHEAWYLLGFVLGDMGKHNEARDATQRAVELNPSLSRAQANLALSPAATPGAGAYVEKAKRENARAIQMEVSHESQLTHFNLGLAFRKKAYYPEALNEYRLALRRGEDRDLVEQAMAEVYLLTRDIPAALDLYDQLLVRRPGSPKLWNERGVALHQGGKYTQAQDSYQHAIAVDPGYAMALNNLGVALYHGGEPDAAFDAFRRALESRGSFIKARLNQALLLYKGRKFQLALEAYRKALAVDSEHPVAWNGVGLVLAELRKFEDARNAFARAIQSRPQYAEAHYNISFTLSNLGEFEGALRETKLALELDPYYVAQKFELAIDVQYEDVDFSIQPNLGEEKRSDEKIEEFDFDPRVLDSLFEDLVPAPRPQVLAMLPTESNPFAMASDFLSKGFFDRAHAEAKRALARGGDRSRGVSLIGDIFSRQGLWGEALERYREARRENPELMGAMSGEASALLRLGRPIDARLVAESVLHRAPNDVETLMLAASARGDAGDPAAALSALETARRVAPMRADIHKHIGDIARKLGDTEGAIDAYRNALQLDPRYAVVRYHLARVYMDREEWRDAEEHLLGALDAVPTYAEATLSLAALRRRRKRPADAMPLLIELLQRDPYHFDALIALGETLLDLGRKQDAVTAFARVLRFDPTHVGALYHEGALLAEQHRYREAVDRWRQVIELAPGSEFARRARREVRTAADLQRIFGAKAAS